MDYYYAQINENNICISVSNLAAPVDMDDMIELGAYDLELLGKKYMGGQWITAGDKEVDAE